MNLTVYIGVFVACSLLCPLIIEAIKTYLNNHNKEYDVQILAAVVTGIISLAICAGYLIVCSAAITPAIVVYIIATVFLSILGSLCGYDKIFKVIIQLITTKDKTTLIPTQEEEE
jgi:hypothetical protein